MLNESERLIIRQRLRDAGFTLKGWCKANGFAYRTVQDVLYYGSGLKYGGKQTRRIFAAFDRYGFLEGLPVDDLLKDGGTDPK